MRRVRRCGGAEGVVVGGVRDKPNLLGLRQRPELQLHGVASRVAWGIASVRKCTSDKACESTLRKSSKKSAQHMRGWCPQ